MEYLLFIATDTDPEPQRHRGHDRGVVRRRRAPRHPQAGRRASPARGRHDRASAQGQLLVTDGPFTESKEWIAGYDIIDCADLDEAIDYVSRHPMARSGRIEIRPVPPSGG